MDDVLLKISEGLEIGYSHTLAKSACEIQLSRGTHYLLARNGRGKTTLLRSLAGALRLRAGVYEVFADRQFVPEDISYFPQLSATQIFKALVKPERLGECMSWADKIELNVGKDYRSLSTGNQRKVSWLMAEFACDKHVTNILLLDEPFTGLDSHAREVIMEYWEGEGAGVCRLVSCHPDFDSMSISSSLLISDGVITHRSADAGESWGELKDQLN